MRDENPLARLLARYPIMTTDDVATLEVVPLGAATYTAGQLLYEEAQTATPTFILVSGMAVAFRNLQDGGRQISEILIPGDICNMHAFLGQPMDHSVAAVTAVRIATVENEAMMGLLTRQPRIATALWWVARREAMRFREHIVAIGRLDARGRVAYLLCDLHDRYDQAGLAQGSQLRMTLTHTRVADTLGLTPVHVGRVLRQFHADKLLRIERGILVLDQVEALRAIASLEDGRSRERRVPEQVRRFMGPVIQAAAAKVEAIGIPCLGAINGSATMLVPT